LNVAADEAEILKRIAAYYVPFHRTVAAIKVSASTHPSLV
jgi:predicted N-formylglutamate amidohydrolase